MVLMFKYSGCLESKKTTCGSESLEAA